MHAQIASLDTNFVQTEDLPMLVIPEFQLCYPLRQAKDSVDVKRIGTDNLGQFLDRRGMANVISYGPQGSLITARINGSAADHSGVFINGVSLNSPSLGLSDFSLIPMNAFSSVGLSQNANDVGFSQGGMSSSITLNNQINRSTNLRLTAGLNSMLNSYATVKGNYHKNNFTWSYLFQQESNKNEFSYIDNHQLGKPKVKQVNNNSRQVILYNHFDYFISNSWNAQAFIWWQRRANNLPEIMGSLGESNAEQRDSLWRAGVTLTWRQLNYYRKVERSFVHFKSTLVQDDQKYSDINHSSDPPTVSISNLRTQLWVNEISGTSHYKRYYSEWNVRQNFLKLENNNYWNNQVVEPFQSAFFSVLRKFRYHDPHYVKGFVYQEWRQHYVSKPSYGISCYLQLSDNILYAPDLTFGASSKFRVPDMNERFWVPGGQRDLKPEEGVNAFVETEWAFRKSDYREFIVQLEGRFSDYNEWIQWVPSEFGNWIPMNLKSVRTYGASVSLDYKRKLGNINLYLKSKYLFTNSRGVNDTKWNRDDSFVMTYTPRNNWYVSADLLFKKWDVGMSYRLYDKRYTTEANLNSQILPSYQLVDVFAGYTFGSKKNIELRVDIQNIFNINYQAIRSYAMPGRVIGLQLNYYPLKK